MDRFAELLIELGKLLETDLRPDVNGACKLYIHEQLQVQIEYQELQERLLMACFLAEIPPGKFRENILKDALKANWPHPTSGTLCYCQRNNRLALFEWISTINLTGQKLLGILNTFISKADKWRIAIETGQTSHLVPTPKSQGNPFGIK